MNAIRIRPAEESDAAAVGGLYRRSFNLTFGHLYDPADLAAFMAKAGDEAFAAAIRDPACRVNLAEGEGGLHGFSCVGDQDIPVETGARWTVLRQLYLEDRARGGGAAQALLDHAIAEARADGAEELYLTVYVDNHRARRFYDRNGFVEVGAYAYRVGNHIDDDRIMRLKL